MASVFSQLPGDLRLQFVRGDELTFSAVFAAVNLTGYTVSVELFTENGNTTTSVATPALTVTTATSGGVTSSTVQVSLTETQTAAVSTRGNTRWYLRWVSPGGVTRTILSGAVIALNP